MSKIIDLSLPVRDHFRWRVNLERVQSFENGDDFQVTRAAWSLHAFTHVDAPRHMLADGYSTSDLRLESLVGSAAILHLADVEANVPITADRLAATGRHLQRGDIALLKTCWDERRSIDQPEFWTQSPYLTREACQWLADLQIRAVGYDFPQDYPIRLLLENRRPPVAEFVSHDVLLRAGIPMIEYLCNLGALDTERTQVFALPLKIPDVDGAPARVIALQD